MLKNFYIHKEPRTESGTYISVHQVLTSIMILINFKAAKNLSDHRQYSPFKTCLSAGSERYRDLPKMTAVCLYHPAILLISPLAEFPVKRQCEAKLCEH